MKSIIKSAIFWLGLTLGFSSLFAKDTFDMSYSVNNLMNFGLIIGFIVPIAIFVQLITKSIRESK